jgi:hypothetical protein
MEGKSQQWIFETLHNLESPNKAIRDQSEAQLAQLPSLIDKLIAIINSVASETDSGMIDGQMRAVIYFKN